MNPLFNYSNHVDGRSVMHPATLISLGLLAILSIRGVADEGTPVVLDRVQVTAGSGAIAVFEVGRAVTVIEANEIVERTPQVLSDALRGQPGVFVQQTTAGQGIPIIRGLKGAEVLHLVDGFRINNAFFRNAPNQYLALVDVHNLESIELLRGPSSGRHGSDAMGGVVQLITARPRAGQIDSLTTRVMARYGSAEQTAMVHAAISYSGTSQALRLGTSALRSGNRRTGSGARLPTAWTSRGADLAWQIQQAGWNAWLDVQFSEQPATPRVDELIPGFGQDLPGFAEFDFRPNSRTFTRLRLEWLATTALFDRAEFQLGRQVIRDDRRSQPLDRSRIDLESNRSRLNGLLASFEREWPDHQLAYGMEVYSDSLQSARSRVIDDQSTPRPSRFPDDSRQESRALWLSNRWQASDRLQIEGSARLSRFVLELPAQQDIQATRITETAPAFDVGLVWSLSPQINLVAGHGRAVRAPNAFDAANLGPRPGNRFNLPNPELGPERLRSSEIGLRQRLSKLEWEMFVWASTARDRISSLETGERTEEGQIIVRNSNIDSARLRGVETILQYQPHPAWHLRTVVNYTTGTLRTPAGLEPADRIPPLHGELSLRWQGMPNIEVWLSMAAAARQDQLSSRDRSDPRIDPNGTGGWAVLGAGISWRPRPELGLRLNLENMTDRRYREHGSGLDAPGRGLWLALDWRG